ncbi:MAG TPA: esterase [Syntrophomonas sp.]|jgi:NTE family protein|nr:esterase [Syntrophomonas sp.]
MAQSPRIALVLGAGSARGLAHIGVLQVLTENRIPFDFIVGSSMGALVGGLYACGTDLVMLGKMIDSMDLRVFFDVHLPRLGFIAGKKMDSLLTLLTKKKSFEETRLPIQMIATDLLTGDSVILESGPVAEAIRASISIPGVFYPVKKEDMILVDGAVSNRLPIEVARSRGADIIIAVDVMFGGGKEINIKNTLDVIITSLDIMQRSQFDQVKELTDVLIQPRVGCFSPRAFDKAAQIIDLGRQAAEENLEQIISKTIGLTRP